MDKHRICKICNRSFANGKAMGGHMRSHLAKLPVSQKSNPSPIPNKQTESVPQSTSSSSSPSNRQTYRSVNGEFFDLVMRDESEAESSKNPTNRRSIRHRKSIASAIAAPPQPVPESVSSVTENILSDEEAAMFLVMLSRDKWAEKEVRKRKEVRKEEVYEYVKDESEEEEEEEDEDTSYLLASYSPDTLTRNKYKCKTCNKRFPSYQALGGHKASHKKMKMQQEGSSAGVGDALLNQRIFKCPFCDKVFDSGQALGGHKKIHFSYLSVTKADTKSVENLIDLNLPAPEVDSEVSQV